MKKLLGGKISAVCLILGAVLLLTAGTVLAVTQLSGEQAKKDTARILEQARTMMPRAMDRVPEERGNNTMASMEMDGVNIAGVLEIPQFAAALPLASAWDTGLVKSMPCRFTGSIYDGSLIIGAVDGEDQFSFASSMETDDLIVLTDMEGGRYTYRVAAIQHAKHATLEKLQFGNYALTIFVKDSRNGEYLLIRCDSDFATSIK